MATTSRPQSITFSKWHDTSLAHNDRRRWHDVLAVARLSNGRLKLFAVDARNWDTVQPMQTLGHLLLVGQGMRWLEHRELQRH